MNTSLIMALIIASPVLIFGLILIFGREPEMEYYEPVETEPEAQPAAPRADNVIEIDTIAAMAHIKNHPAMRFVAKG